MYSNPQAYLHVLYYLMLKRASDFVKYEKKKLQICSFFVVLDPVMGSLQVEFGSSELGNNAIMKFHTDTVIFHCLTEHNITTNSMEHSAS